MSNEKITAYKAFDKDLKCRGYQYEIGKEYEQDGPIVACHSGFHACERPLDVLSYYPPSSRFCVVEQSGELSRDTDDTKVASSKIKIGAEIGIPGLVKAQVEYVKAHTTTAYTDPNAATAGDCGAATAGDRGAATAGDRGAATAGYCGAATADNYGAATAGDYGAATAGNYGAATAGDRGAATAGYCGAATAGNRGAATAGDYGAATAGNRGAATAGDCGFALSGGSSACGKNGIAVARGERPRAKGGDGATLVLTLTDSMGRHIRTDAMVIQGPYKPDTWYTLGSDGIQEVPAHERL